MANQQVFQIIEDVYFDDGEVTVVKGTFATKAGAEARRREIILKDHALELSRARAELKAASAAMRQAGPESPALRAFLDHRAVVLYGEKPPTLRQLQSVEAQAKTLGVPMNIADHASNVASARAWIKRLENIELYVSETRWPKIKTVTLSD